MLRLVLVQLLPERVLGLGRRLPLELEVAAVRVVVQSARRL
jgi:hypothetical protein